MISPDRFSLPPSKLCLVEEGGAGRKEFARFFTTGLADSQQQCPPQRPLLLASSRSLHCCQERGRETRGAGSEKPQTPESDLALASVRSGRGLGSCPSCRQVTRVPVSSAIGSVVPDARLFFFPVLVPCLPVQPPESQPHPTPSLAWGCWGRPSHHFCVMHHPFLSPSA